MKAQLEKIYSPAQGSFKVFMYEGEKFDAPWHFHPEYELTYIVSSDGMRYVGDNVMEFEAGDLVLLGANLPHCWKNTENSQGPAKSIVVQWKEDVLGDGWLDALEFNQIRRLLTLSSRGLKFNLNTNKEIVPILKEMCVQPPFEKMISLLRVLNVLAKNNTYEYLSGDNFSVKLDSEINNRINKIHDFVSENYKNRITLFEISSLVNMSEETFCRFFKRTFNKTFFTFLNEYKIKLACKFLIESDYQVTEIAFKCGYESLPFFYRQFNKFIGCSPLVYQQKYTSAFDK